VAIAGDEEIAGYGLFQIWEENPKIVEMAQGVVKPEFPSPWGVLEILPNIC
jgi:hypothetical protein